MKKLTYLISLAIIFPVVLSAQYDEPCLPDGIRFMTQAQIDNFQTDYPNCTEIQGDVTISGFPLNIGNLNGLSVLTSLGASLMIKNNDALINLTGLDNVTNIGGNLEIYNNATLTSLSGLENVTSIGGYLNISSNNALTSLTGLEGLTSIGGNLRIIDNDTLTSLSGLENLDSIWGNLGIGVDEWGYGSGNQSLVSLTSLDHEIYIDGDLYIAFNDFLTECEVQSVCDYLVSPNGSVNIYNNASGCNNPAEVANACGNTLHCLPYGNYYFLSQTDIDNFQSNYPNCTEIEGNVKINGPDFTNLNGLNVITSIGGDLRINNRTLTNLTGLENLTSIGGGLSIYQNRDLINLTGLENLTSIGEYLSIWFNSALTSLSGLENVNSIGGRIGVVENASLISLKGLDNVTTIGEGMDIGYNDTLNSLTGLENVTSIEGDLWIYNNNTLPDLAGLKNVISIAGLLGIDGNASLNTLIGLENVTSIGGSLRIIGNTNLPSLSGLDNIDANSINNLHINRNHWLSTCEVISVCNYLASPNGDIEIHSNAPGCKSQQEVEEACETVFIEEENFLDEIFIHPNPFSTSTTIAFESTQPGKVELKIYNQLGELIEIIQKTTQAGKQTFNWDASNLPSGIYFIRLQIDNELITRKMIKLK